MLITCRWSAGNIVRHFKKFNSLHETTCTLFTTESRLSTFLLLQLFLVISLSHCDKINFMKLVLLWCSDGISSQF